MTNNAPLDEATAGIAWWNALGDAERLYWAQRAGSGIAADAWRLHQTSQYRLEIEGLEDAVTAARPDAKHAGLMRAVRSLPGLAGARLVRIDDSGNTSLVRRKVLRANGDVVHDDHEHWLANELAADAGDVPTTRRRLAALDLRLSKCPVATLRIAVDRGGEQANITQVTVQQLEEHLDCRLFDAREGWGMPHTLRDLIYEAQGPVVADEERQRIGESIYRLREVIDVAAFVRVAQAQHQERLEAFGRRSLRVTVQRGQEPQREQVMTGAELYPEFNRQPCREQRLFDDWASSSAGRGGARISEHWSFGVADSIDAVTGKPERWMSFVPEWATNTRKLAKLETRKLNDYEVFGKLQALDERVGVPFAWYFFMLHGNRVQSTAAERVLAAAEAGTVVLPEHDYQVLKRWSQQSYGF